MGRQAVVFVDNPALLTSYSKRHRRIRESFQLNPANYLELYVEFIAAMFVRRAVYLLPVDA